jgi:lipoprotein NlpI/transglutaminase-like putative cysteine protease
MARTSRASRLAWLAMTCIASLLPALCQAQSAAPAKAAAGTSPAATAPAARKAPPAKPAAAPTAPAALAFKNGFAQGLAPVPAWVVPAPLAAGAPPEAAPMHYRVIDEQLRVDAGSMAEYTRVVRVVNQSAGLTVASQIELEFDPSYQTLAIHKLDIVRDGQRLPRFDLPRIQLLQREKQLEQRIYDGRTTVSIVLDDVRVGDEIDLAYTTSGQNPVFGGKFAHLAWMVSQRGPVLSYQVRLLAPAARSIQVKKGPPDATVQSSETAGWRETVFRRQNVPLLRPEPGAPYAVVLPEQVQFSEFADWAEVAAWGDALFRAGSAGPRVQARADTLRSEQAQPGDRVREALRFVQQEVRYFGVEIGPGTHQPNPPDKVVEQRFGDCKDKVALLNALLQRLDVPARPVLVSTRLRGAVAQMLPSPLAFDHVISRVDVDGKPLYLDPTRNHQSGPLAVRESLGLGQGLELVAGPTALTPLPRPFDAERMRVEDTLRFETIAGEPTLESRITYRGDLAESLRDAIAQQGLQPMAEALTAAYVKIYPRVRRLAPASLEPVPDDDAVRLVQRFAVPEFWRFPEQRALAGDVALWGVAEALIPPKAETRRQPLSIGLPGVYRHRLRVEFPEDVFQQAASRRFDEGDSHFSLVLQVEGGKRQVDYNAEMRLRVDQIEADRWPAFTSAVNKAVQRLGTTMSVSAIPIARSESLGAELKALEEGVRRQNPKVVTPLQAQSLFRVKLLGAQIDSGRLPPLLQAQALVARGIAHDQTGKLELGQRDFDAALALDPASVDALNAAATNAQTRGDLDRAVALATQVLDKQPRDGQALGTRALAHYMAGRWPQARADWQAQIRDADGLRRGYPLIWLALAAKREKQDVAPLATAYPAADWPGDWPRPVLDLLFGRTSAASVLEAAKATKTPLEAQTEAGFYAGEAAAADGDAGKARDFWRRAVDLGVVEFVEHGLARRRLDGAR